MKPFIFFLSFFIFSFFSAAQHLEDDFTDGNFTKSPAWSGDTSRFEVVSQALRLADETPASTNESALSVVAPVSTDAVTTWECLVRLDFAPSSSNFARIYLQTNTAVLSDPLEGYFLQVGGISGSEDALRLFRQDGDQTYLLMEGTAGAVGEKPALARIRVVRDTGGVWMLYADYRGGRNFQLEGIAQDDTYKRGSYFGVYCRYTSSRASAFTFDDFLIAPLFEDEAPPVLLTAVAESATFLRLEFDEPLMPASATNPASYTINNGIGTPRSAETNPGSPAQVRLRLSTPLRNLTDYTLTASGIRDLSGNTASAQHATFTFFDIQAATGGDLLITEIMADPSPAVGLPEAEYLELYNNSEKVLQLGDLSISTGGTARPLPQKRMLPHTYVLLCDEAYANAFEAFGDLAPLSNFPSLTNGGDEITLTGPKGDTLLLQRYAADWYRHEDKNKGGYSLELVRRNAPAYCAANWMASRDARGGTPAQPNSVDGQPIDGQPPRLLRAAAISPSEVLIFFDEALSDTATEPMQYQITPEIPVDMAILQLPDKREVLLLLDTRLQPGTVYTLQVESGLRDCLDNPSSSAQRFTFGLPDPIAAGDLIINEVLFHPQVGGSDFIELYNRSGKILDLEELDLLNARKSSGQVRSTVGFPYLLFPGAYVVLTESPEDIQTRYRVKTPSALLENPLPTLNADAGNITLRAGRTTIDSFDYSEDMHYSLLDNTRGVSLERIDPDSPTQSSSNWHSAASTQGYATPTAPNSQLVGSGEIEGIFELERPTFSPDGDGFEDVLLIRYRTDRPGYILNLRVFDAQGRPISTLADNLLLAAEGQLKWDGITDQKNRARLGIYVLWFELFSTDGRVLHQRISCVLAGHLSD